jgi:hypothetical protein
MKTILITALAAAAIAIPTDAAIPRETELVLQAKAPEQLEIEIVAVNKRRRLSLSEFKITATAKIVKVNKTAAGLEAGSEVTIRYSVPTKPIPGAPPPVVQKGKRYAAFLRKVDGAEHFQPAAASGSFDVLAAE